MPQLTFFSYSTATFYSRGSGSKQTLSLSVVLSPWDPLFHSLFALLYFFSWNKFRFSMPCIVFWGEYIQKRASYCLISILSWKCWDLGHSASYSYCVWNWSLKWGMMVHNGGDFLPVLLKCFGYWWTKSSFPTADIPYGLTTRQKKQGKAHF